MTDILTLGEFEHMVLLAIMRLGEDAYAVPLQSLFILYDTLLYGLELPPTVVTAINRKVEQYYIVQEYGFRVEREKKESERKRIEAQGISEFQKIVSEGITPSYLRWRGVDATLQLSLSTNSKVVVLGSGNLIQTLLRHHLVDEYLLMIHPIVPGTGLRLFPDGGAPTAMTLVDTTTTTTGVILASHSAA